MEFNFWALYFLLHRWDVILAILHLTQIVWLWMLKLHQLLAFKDKFACHVSLWVDCFEPIDVKVYLILVVDFTFNTTQRRCEFSGFCSPPRNNTSCRECNRDLCNSGMNLKIDFYILMFTYWLEFCQWWKFCNRAL